MAIEMIYGPNQTAGIAVVGVAKSTPKSDGTKPYAQLTAQVDASGNVIGGGVNYETVAASQTGQVLGGAGATGDFLGSLLVTPTTTSPGVVTILDNAISIPVFAGGATSLSNLVPFVIPIEANSVSGAWKVTTGAGLSVVATGRFT